MERDWEEFYYPLGNLEDSILFMQVISTEDSNI